MCQIPCSNPVAAFMATKADQTRTYEACAHHGTEADHKANIAARAVTLKAAGWSITWDPGFAKTLAGQGQVDLYEERLKAATPQAH